MPFQRACLIHHTLQEQPTDGDREIDQLIQVTTFELAMDHIPDNFLVSDIQDDESRHLIFSTPEQREILKDAKTWYSDATFRVVKSPFTQLFSVHAFVKGADEQVKQLPLAFALMSRRRKRDYKKVLWTIKQSLPGINLKTIILDF